jgi:hypothetical protein
MKPLSFAAVLGAAAVLAALPAVGTAVTPAASNTIALQSYAISSYAGNNEVSSPSQGNVRVSFRNDGAVVANAVIFDVLDDGAYAGHIVDVGTFSKGVTITHEFHWVDAHEGESLQIAQVRYADGTIWGADGPRTPRRQPPFRQPAYWAL